MDKIMSQASDDMEARMRQLEEDNAALQKENSATKKDNAAMKELLQARGLLMDLPSTHLNRLVKPEDLPAVYVEQIELRGDAFKDLHENSVSWLNKGVKALAQLPEQRLSAIESVINVSATINDFADQTIDFEYSFFYHTLYNTINDTLGQSLKDMLSTHYRTMLAAEQDWDPYPVIQQIVAVARELKRNDWAYNGMSYLQMWQNERVSHVLANKVAGHRLPPELVEVIRQCLCEDVDVYSRSDRILASA